MDTAAELCFLRIFSLSLETGTLPVCLAWGCVTKKHNANTQAPKWARVIREPPIALPFSAETLKIPHNEVYYLYKIKSHQKLF